MKDGEEAMALYNELFYWENKQDINDKLQQLKTYCYTDTYVLYEIVEALKKITD
ncbi:MAG TPA: hypothetical protein PKZ14_03700 [Chitinophagales bacterium]|nr:hypothetical protein [Chitinophagales bacterium]